MELLINLEGGGELNMSFPIAKDIHALLEGLDGNCDWTSVQIIVTRKAWQEGQAHD